MFGKVGTTIVAAAVAGIFAFSAPAAFAQSSTTPAPTAQPAAKPAPMKMTKKHTAAKPASTSTAAAKPASHHKMSCYDYAWESKAMNDCLAKMGSSKKTS